MSAQAEFLVDWFSLDGGGEFSSSGAYTLQGSLGQSDTATLSGGAYTLQGGFWSLLNVETTEGSPLLRIFVDADNVTLAWPNPSSGFQLQETVNLVAPNWTDVSGLPDVVGNEKQVSQLIVPTGRFYRLLKP